MSEYTREESVLDRLIHSDIPYADVNAVYELYCKMSDVWQFLRKCPDIREIARTLDRIDGGEREKECP